MFKTTEVADVEKTIALLALPARRVCKTRLQKDDLCQSRCGILFKRGVLFGTLNLRHGGARRRFPQSNDLVRAKQI